MLQILRSRCYEICKCLHKYILGLHCLCVGLGGGGRVSGIIHSSKGINCQSCLLNTNSMLIFTLHVVIRQFAYSLLLCGYSVTKLAM